MTTTTEHITEHTKVALVTGANRGIGLETSRQLAKRGVRVLLGARAETSGREAEARLRGEGLDVHFIPIDVTHQASVDAAAEQIRADFGKLDILVNNAGVNLQGDGPPSTAQEEALRRVYEVNVFGVFRVTQAMLPLLKEPEFGVYISTGSCFS